VLVLGFITAVASTAPAVATTTVGRAGIGRFADRSRGHGGTCYARGFDCLAAVLGNGLATGSGDCGLCVVELYVTGFRTAFATARTIAVAVSVAALTSLAIAACAF